MTSPLVAVLDSGVHLGHPHVAGASIRGFSLDGDAAPFGRSEDFSDRTGHGTAATAALLRLLPHADVLAVRLLDADLRTTSAALAAGIIAAANEGARVINLSLGSQAAEAEALLADAHPRGATLWPADLPSVIGVTTQRACPLADLYTVDAGAPRFLAHGFPRPIEGRPPTDNLFGPSFAAVTVSARVAAILRDDPGLGFGGVVRRLQAAAVGAWGGT
jgi:hypothetical protein